jgi:hypothetical protein
MTYLLLIEGLLALILLVYLVRSTRIIGSKLTSNNSSLTKKLNEITKLISEQERSNRVANQLLYLPLILEQNSKFEFVVTLTSHKARFSHLAQVIQDLKNQTIQPAKILLNIAHDEIQFLPADVITLENEGYIQIVSCEDFGPAKKLIPTLKSVDEMPIIVLDDDLLYKTDLFLQLMIAHRLNPTAIISARTHRLTQSEDGEIQDFRNWDKQFEIPVGLSKDLMPTSGAGTLFPTGSLHPDASDGMLYAQYAKNTDDLWWYFQARRNGTLVMRIEGFGSLNFVPDSQEVGLWNNGNKERNEVNLKALLGKYGNPLLM